MLAKTVTGLEEVLADELIALGAIDVKTLNRAVSFVGDNGFMYKANLWCRTALRILKPIKTCTVASNEDLYNEVYAIEWENYIQPESTIAVDAVINDSFFHHSQFVAQKTKDAIVDRFRQRTNQRPTVDLQYPDLKINIHIYKKSCTISLDSSGESLHKRGYRKQAVEAPLSEVLAAGLILLSGWNKQSNFVDPMCGSGTILIEAALIANNIPPGYYRQHFGFFSWNDFDEELWETIKYAALNKHTEFDYAIVGSDISERSISIANENIRFAKLHKDISLQVIDFSDSKAPEGKGILITNPPYGERLKEEDIIEFYKNMGDVLKKKYAGYDAWIISSDIVALKSVGLHATRNIRVTNGPLECKFCKFTLYQGKKYS